MGCDIHVLTEKYNKNKGWINVDDWRINPYYGDNEYETEKYEIKTCYDNRNYELFTVLANVRNYYNNIVCIKEPKGIPNDISEESNNYIENWGEDGHSHSWYTLKELYDYWVNMNGKTKRTGILVGSVLDNFDKKGEEPTLWSQGYWGNEKSARRTWEVEYNPLTEFITVLIERFCDEFWIFHIKKEEYKTDERLKKSIEENGDNYRVIFFFDN